MTGIGESSYQDMNDIMQVFFAYFASLGYQVIAEDATDKGRVDLTVITRSSIWIIEFEI